MSNTPEAERPPARPPDDGLAAALAEHRRTATLREGVFDQLVEHQTGDRGDDDAERTDRRWAS
jgi:hypothetical protein